MLFHTRSRFPQSERELVVLFTYLFLFCFHPRTPSPSLSLYVWSGLRWGNYFLNFHWPVVCKDGWQESCLLFLSFCGHLEIQHCYRKLFKYHNVRPSPHIIVSTLFSTYCCVLLLDDLRSFLFILIMRSRIVLEYVLIFSSVQHVTTFKCVDRDRKT